MTFDAEKINKIIADICAFFADFAKKLSDALSKINVHYGYETTEAAD